MIINHKISSLTFTVLLSLCFFSTKADIESANNLFKAGNYAEAKIEYAKLGTEEAKIRYNKCVELESMLEVAQDYLSRSQFQTGIKVCEEILKYNPQDQKALKIKSQCQNGIKKLQQERQNLFDEAKEKSSIVLLNAFKEKYKKQDYWVSRADSLISDIPLWKEADKKNTKDSYQNYLNNSKYGFYAEQAKWNIGAFDCEEYWNDKKNSRDKQDFKLFKARYSKYNKHLEEADANIKLLDAVDNFNANELRIAFYNFTEAKKNKNITFLPSDEEMLRISKDYVDYDNLGANANVSMLKKYIDEHPLSNWRDVASSRISRLLADELTGNSSKDLYDAIRDLAKDSSTKNYVENRIHVANKARKRIITKEYGKLFSMGLSFVAGFNPKSFEAGGGVDFRIGRCINWVNLTFGAQYYRLYDYGNKKRDLSYYENDGLYNYYEDSKSKDINLGQRVVIPIHLKFNLFPAGDHYRFYIGCGAEYGFNIAKGTLKYDDYDFDEDIFSEHTLSIIPEFGFAGKHQDLSFFYKWYQDLYNDDLLNTLDRSLFNVESDLFDNKWFGGVRYIVYF